MLETPAVIVRAEETDALVTPDYGGGCGSGMCNKGGCGTAILAQLFSRHPRGPMLAGNPIQGRPGERVVVGVEEGMLVRATVLAYLLPLVLLFAGALLGRSYGNGVAALGALLGLFSGWALAWLLARSLVRRAKPVILRRV